jgi:hypothetical protein
MRVNPERSEFAWGTVICSEQASRRQITIPASYLSYLPASQTEQGVPYGSLLLYNSSVSNKFEASGGLDAGYVVSLGYWARPLTFE